jgi:WD40 repeat protein
LCSQYAAKDYHRFLVGTCSLHDSNELSILQYFEDSNHFDVSCSFTHPDQIWAIEASPKDPSLVITSRQSLNASRSLTLWRLPQQDAESLSLDSAGDNHSNEQLDLTEVASFCHTQKAASVRDIKWSTTEDTLLTIDNKMLSAWKIGESSISLDNGLPLGDESQYLQEGCVCWDPHNAKQCAVGLGRALRLVDTREMEITSEQVGAHEENIR